MMTNTLILFIDRSIIYYLGFKSSLEENNVKVVYSDEVKLRASRIFLQHRVNCIFYHIFKDSNAELVAKNLKKLKRVFPKAKTFACLHEINNEVINISKGAGFNGFFLAEDQAKDIIALLNEVMEKGIGMSQNMAKKYWLMLHKKKVKPRKSLSIIK